MFYLPITVSKFAEVNKEGNVMGRKGKQRSQQPTSSQPDSFVQNQFMNNEFLQFYASLHVSSVMYSSPEFQYQVMFPFLQPHHQPSTQEPVKDKKTHKVPHHERRLAEVADEEEDSIPSSAAEMNSLSRKWKKRRESEIRQLHSGQNGMCPVPGEFSPEKRRVSFSKNSPRRNLITPPPPKPRKQYFDPRKSLPQMIWSKGGEINLWSSDMEESDTTETTSSRDEDSNNSSTLEEETTKENVPLVIIPENCDGKIDT